MLAIAVNVNKVTKTDTKQAYLFRDIGDDVAYIRLPNWWPEPVPEGNMFLLLKSIYGTLQAAHKWHINTSTWMENHTYSSTNIIK